MFEGMCQQKDDNGSCSFKVYRVSGLRNHFILDEVVQHKSISQIWWNDHISRTSTNYLFVGNEVMKDQPILFHKPNKK